MIDKLNSENILSVEYLVLHFLVKIEKRQIERYEL